MGPSLGVVKMVRDADPHALARCLEMVSGALSSCDALVAAALVRAAGSLSTGDVFCTYAWLKLALEAAVQRAYYTMLGVPWEEALRRIARRSRSAASFTASMVRQLRGIHGVRRRWVLRTYLRLGTWLHPSIEMRRAGGLVTLDEELVRDVLDAIAYLCLTIDEMGDGLRDAVGTCGLEKTGRLLSKKGGSA